MGDLKNNGLGGRWFFVILEAKLVLTSWVCCRNIFFLSPENIFFLPHLYQAPFQLFCAPSYLRRESWGKNLQFTPVHLKDLQSLCLNPCPAADSSSTCRQIPVRLLDAQALLRALLLWAQPRAAPVSWGSLSSALLPPGLCWAEPQLCLLLSHTPDVQHFTSPGPGEEQQSREFDQLPSLLWSEKSLGFIWRVVKVL